ncbi:unnamed protein product [Protopolystoma xenopodis]|uniref:Uncharacterized protein n=1 Tax=Protopolystoma xenopodis TaxID=117903 RepID=A0A3S5AVU2_9PLAT|nr:unnamed protein product [Protopolystoma xenopodis]
MTHIDGDQLISSTAHIHMKQANLSKGLLAGLTSNCAFPPFIPFVSGSFTPPPHTMPQTSQSKQAAESSRARSPDFHQLSPPDSQEYLQQPPIQQHLAADASHSVYKLPSAYANSEAPFKQTTRTFPHQFHLSSSVEKGSQLKIGTENASMVTKMKKECKNKDIHCYAKHLSVGRGRTKYEGQNRSRMGVLLMEKESCLHRKDAMQQPLLPLQQLGELNLSPETSCSLACSRQRHPRLVFEEETRQNEHIRRIEKRDTELGNMYFEEPEISVSVEKEQSASSLLVQEGYEAPVDCSFDPQRESSG